MVVLSFPAVHTAACLGEDVGNQSSEPVVSATLPQVPGACMCSEWLIFASNTVFLRVVDFIF